MSLLAEVQSEYRVQLTLTPTKVGTWTVYRTDGATSARVRGPRIVHTAGAGPYLIADREPPLGRQVNYYALHSDGTRDYSAWVTVTSALPVLSDPISGIHTTLTIKEWPAKQRSARRQVLDVPGRVDPIVVTEVMGSASSSPLLRTDTPAANAVVEDLVETGHTLQLRSPDAGVDDVYLSVSQWTVSRLRNDAADVHRYHQLEATHVGMPDPDVAATVDTLAMLNAAVPGTLADIAARWPTTLLTIAQADLSGGGL